MLPGYSHGALAPILPWSARTAHSFRMVLCILAPSPLLDDQPAWRNPLEVAALIPALYLVVVHGGATFALKKRRLPIFPL